MRCSAIELLTEIRDLLRNLDTLEERRAVKAAQQARYRAKKRSVAAKPCRSGEARTPPLRRCGVSPHLNGGFGITSVDTTQNVDTTKEDEKGKETFPPAPPIENKGKAEEKKNKNARARARSVPPTPDEVAAFCRERKSSVDPVLWWSYYAARGWMIGNSKMVDWKRAVIAWERNRGECGRDKARPSLDPRTAAFERQRAEAEERRRHAEAVAASLLEHRRAELAGLATGDSRLVGRGLRSAPQSQTNAISLRDDCGGEGTRRPTKPMHADPSTNHQQPTTNHD